MNGDPCKHCGVEPTAHRLELPAVGVDKTYYIHPCDCAAKILEDREEAEQERRRTEHVNKLWSMADLGPRFTEANFKAWEKRPELTAAAKAAWEIATEWPEANGLLLHGGTGTGKSHLASAVVNTLIPRGVSCVFRSVPDLLARIRESYNKHHTTTEGQLIHALKVCDLLVMDDIGAHRDTGSRSEWEPTWAEEKLFTIIDHRYRFKAPTIYTTNLDLPELADSIGKRATSRIIEVCDIYEIVAEDWREKQARLNRANGEG